MSMALCFGFDLSLAGQTIDAEVAAGAVLGGHLDRVLLPLELGALEVGGLEGGRGLAEVGGVVDLRADGRVGADERALVALDADLVVPDGDLERDRALLPLGGGGRPGAVHGEGADRQQVALALDDDRLHALDEVGRRLGHGRAHLDGAGGRADRDLVEVLQGRVHRGEVALDDLRALLAVGLLDRLLDLGDRLLARQDAGDREEAGLHDRVDAAAHAGLLGHVVGVDGVDLQLLVDDLVLDLARQVLPDLVLGVGRVQQEGAARHRVLEHVVALEEAELVAGHEVRLLDEVGGADGAGAEAQVGDRDGARLLGVVDEVALGVVLRLLADDLDGVLVGAHRAVGAEAEEDGAHAVVGVDVEVGVDRDRGVGHVVHDADREVVARALAADELVEDRLHLRGGEVLRGEAVAPAHHHRVDGEGAEAGLAGLADRGHHVEVERLADGAGLLGAVEDGDRADGAGEGGREVLHRERPDEPDLEDADLLALRHEVVDRLVRDLGARAHQHDHALGLRVADVLEELVGAAGALAEAGHRLLDDPGAVQVEAVAGLAGLEEDVGVLRGAAQDRLVRGEGPLAVRGDEVVAHHEAQVVVLEHARSSGPRARCGSRRRSGGRAPGPRGSRRGPRGRGRGPPGPSRRRAGRTRSGGRPSRPSGRRRSTGRGRPRCGRRRAS